MKLSIRKSIVSVLLVALLFGAAVMWGPLLFHWAEERYSADTTQGPAEAEQQRSLVVSGYVDAPQGVAFLYPLESGRVAAVLVKENQSVKAGDVLLRLDEEAARWRVEQARAALQAAKAELAQAQLRPKQYQSKITQQKLAIEERKHQAAAARHQLEKKEDLFRKGFLSEEDEAAIQEKLRQAQAGLKAEEEKLHELQLHDPTQMLDEAQSSVTAKEAQVHLAEYALQQHSLRAPADGLVLRVTVAPGDVLGSDPTEPAVYFAAAEPPIIRLDVEQEFVSRVQVGAPVEIEDFADPQQRWTGKVIRKSSIFLPRRTLVPRRAALLEDDSRSLECLAALDDPDAPVQFGQRVRVTIHFLDAPAGKTES